MGQELGVQGLQEEEGARCGPNGGRGCRGSLTLVYIQTMLQLLIDFKCKCMEYIKDAA